MFNYRLASFFITLPVPAYLLQWLIIIIVVTVIDDGNSSSISKQKSIDSRLRLVQLTDWTIIELNDGRKLTGDDLQSLKPNGWITNTILDYAVCNVIDHRNLLLTSFSSSSSSSSHYIYVTTNEVLLTSKWNPDNLLPSNFFIRTSIKDKIVLFPYNYDSNHWVLLICDIANLQFELYDPLLPDKETYDARVEHCLNLVLKMFEVRNRLVADNTERVRTKNWSVKRSASLFMTRQTPGDCGIYLIKLIDRLINKAFSFDDALSYRNHILDTIRSRAKLKLPELAWENSNQKTSSTKPMPIVRKPPMTPMTSTKPISRSAPKHSSPNVLEYKSTSKNRSTSTPPHKTGIAVTSSVSPETKNTNKSAAHSKCINNNIKSSVSSETKNTNKMTRSNNNNNNRTTRKSTASVRKSTSSSTATRGSTHSKMTTPISVFSKSPPDDRILSNSTWTNMAQKSTKQIKVQSSNQNQYVQEQHQIEEVDLKSLEDEHPITANAMDYVIRNILDIKNQLLTTYGYINPRTASFMLREPDPIYSSSSAGLDGMLRIGKTTVLIPFHYPSNQWAVIIADFQRKFIDFCDPLKQLNNDLIDASKYYSTANQSPSMFVDMSEMYVHNFLANIDHMKDDRPWKMNQCSLTDPKLSKNNDDLVMYVIRYIDYFLNERFSINTRRDLRDKVALHLSKSQTTTAIEFDKDTSYEYYQI